MTNGTSYRAPELKSGNEHSRDYFALCRRRFAWRLAFFATPGPSICLTNRNTPRWNAKFPQCLELENCGDKVACNLEWEIREYENALLPAYQSRRSKRIGPLRPGERLVIDVGSESADAALLARFEIFLTYRGPDGARFRSHLAVDGEVKRNDSGFNGARWLVASPLTRIWMREFRDNLVVRARMKMRPLGLPLRQRWNTCRRAFRVPQSPISPWPSHGES